MKKTDDIKTSEGQLVSRITVTIDGVTIPVVPISIAAFRMDYSVRHVRNLCNWEQLIAIKISGLWFVHELECELYPQKVRDREPA